MNSSVPAESHENEKRRLIGSSVVLIALSTIFVILRLVSRKLSKAGFWVRFPTFANNGWMLTATFFFFGDK